MAAALEKVQQRELLAGSSFISDGSDLLSYKATVVPVSLNFLFAWFLYSAFSPVNEKSVAVPLNSLGRDGIA